MDGRNLIPIAHDGSSAVGRKKEREDSLIDRQIQYRTQIHFLIFLTWKKYEKHRISVQVQMAHFSSDSYSAHLIYYSWDAK